MTDVEARRLRQLTEMRRVLESAPTEDLLLAWLFALRRNLGEDAVELRRVAKDTALYEAAVEEFAELAAKQEMRI